MKQTGIRSLANEALLTQARLRELLTYFPDLGKWKWNVRRNGVRNEWAGTPDGSGYIQIRIAGIKYRACRLAFLFMRGTWPPQLVDHINRNVGDDRWENLRLASRSQNGANACHPKRKRFDLPQGVTEHPGGYLAKISIDGYRKHVGLFKTPEEAQAAYLNASAFRAEFLPEGTA
jgi:hypothetical protein